jgi:glycosyltransferase involved in cell wall biosynthesis
MGAHGMSTVSILILTLNEENNLADCIDSCSWSDDIVVFDSLSQDRTQHIATAKGARVIERAFDDYASQRNAALNAISFKHAWVLMVDADERVPKELAKEIETRVAHADAETVLFRIRRRDFFLGQWLKRSSGYPTWFGRLVRPSRVKVTREVNEEYIADGRIEYLDQHLHHFPFNKGIAYWFERHNRYSSMEAVAKIARHSQPLTTREFFSVDPIIRRRALKHCLYRVPMRPIIVFLYLYFIRLGVLDGRAGFYFCRMRAIYEFFIDLKVTEANRRRRGLAV